MDNKSSFKWFKFILVLVAVFMFGYASGCASPAASYVKADAAAWAVYDRDNTLDKWINQAEERGDEIQELVEEGRLSKEEAAAKMSEDAALSKDRADALRDLNVARRARISHALDIYVTED